MKTSYFKLIFGFLICFSCACKMHQSGEQKDKLLSSEPSVWEQADQIVSSITVPTFPNRDFNISDYGAVGDGMTKNTLAFKKAIKACANSGGGRVVVPKGRYLTGPIHLKSNVNLHLSNNSEILFSQDQSDYLPVVHTSYEGVELMNYSPLVYAKGQSNIAITGTGTLNGQANINNWWPWCGKTIYGHRDGQPEQKDAHNLPILRKMNESGTPVKDRVFGEGHQLRPLFFEPLECENILIKDVTFTNAPFWIIHPLKSKNITVDGVTIRSHGPNNDGCDPEYSKNVHIINCLFDTGDDCIAIKSGRNNDGRRVNIPSENIIVENCEMKDGHGGVVMGSEISAGVRNVFVRNCTMDSPNLDRAIRIKTNTLRGGFVENIYVRDITVGQVKESVLRINTFYGIYDNQEGAYLPRIRNINLENITVDNGGDYGLLIKGRVKMPIKGVTLKNVIINNVKNPLSVENCEPVTFVNTTINGKYY